MAIPVAAGWAHQRSLMPAPPPIFGTRRSSGANVGVASGTVTYPDPGG